jgi:hypothetical protein
MATDKNVPQPQLTYERTEDFSDLYANNIFYETSSWDLKLIFGQLDQSEGKAKVAQHTAIAVPWPMVKLMVYWLRGQIEAHELVNGKIHVPPPLIPSPLPPLTEELRKLDPNAEAVYAIFNRLRDEFAASLKS